MLNCFSQKLWFLILRKSGFTPKLFLLIKFSDTGDKFFIFAGNRDQNFEGRYWLRNREVALSHWLSWIEPSGG